MTHRSRVCAVGIDTDPERYEAAARFWSAALGRGPEEEGPYTNLPGPEVDYFVQRIEEGSPRVHLDVETDDVLAEVARLRGLEPDAFVRLNPGGSWRIRVATSSASSLCRASSGQKDPGSGVDPSDAVQLGAGADTGRFAARRSSAPKSLCRPSRAAMKEPIVSTDGTSPLAGGCFEIREWSHGPKGPRLHVHYSDDEAWHVLEGTLRFRFADRTVDVGAGTTVMAPAGVAHTYGNPGPGDVRYLIITTPRVFALIEALHGDGIGPDAFAEVSRRYDSEVLE